MSDRPMPQVGQTYKHWKGGTYKVSELIHGFSEKDEFNWAGRFQSYLRYGDTVVVYEDANGRKYIRALSNFMEILSSGAGDNAINWYRFELIQESAA